MLPAVIDLVESWRFVVLSTALAASAALGFSLLLPAQFTATASLLPEQRSGSLDNSGLAGIASQLGVGLQTGTQNPQLYVELLTSREVMTAVLASSISATGGRDSARILDLIVNEDGDEASRLEQGVNELRSRVSTKVNPRTGLISISVVMGTPVAAESAARRMIEVLELFNSQTRRSQAREKRKFAEMRLHEVEDSLDLAEKRTREFLEQNRQYRTSPNLTFEYERLQRQISSYQTLYSQIRGQYEAARISEVNDTPVLSVIDEPIAPVTRSSPSLKRATATGLVLGAILSIGMVLLRAALGRMREQDPRSFLRLREAFAAPSRRGAGSDGTPSGAE